jgi:hypothetical protein
LRKVFSRAKRGGFGAGKNAPDSDSEGEVSEKNALSAGAAGAPPERLRLPVCGKTFRCRRETLRVDLRCGATQISRIEKLAATAARGWSGNRRICPAAASLQMLLAG